MDAQLQNRMARRRLSHAYLITGADREELAKTLSAAYVCTGPTPPCGQCSGCRKASQNIHPDILWTDPEGEGLKAEAVRNLRSDAYILPNEAPTKVYILTHSELLNQTGQNILLKLIEEGPDYARFLFLTPNPEILLETIRSRCETLRASVEDQRAATEDGETLARFILTDAPPAETASFVLSLDKKKREEIAALLDETAQRLAKEVPARPDLVPILDKLEPIRTACQYNISPGHLSGWIASIL